MLMGEGCAWDVDELGHLELKKRQFETMRLEWKRHSWPLQTSRGEGMKEQMQRWSVLMSCLYLVRKTPQSLVWCQGCIFPAWGLLRFCRLAWKGKATAASKQSKLTDTILFPHLFFAQEYRGACFRQLVNYLVIYERNKNRKLVEFWLQISKESMLKLQQDIGTFSPTRNSIISCRSGSWRCRTQNSSQTLE